MNLSTLLPPGHCHSFHHDHFSSFMLAGLHWVPSGYESGVSWRTCQGSASLQPALSLVQPHLCFNCEFPFPALILVLVSLLLFHLYQSVPCFDYLCYIKYHVDFDTGRLTTRLNTLLPVCELNNSDQLLTLKEVMRSLITWCPSVIYVVICGPKLARFVVDAVTLGKYAMTTEI